MIESKYDLSDPDAVLFCPSCGSGYTAKATRCADCDEQLVSRTWVEAQAQEEPGQETSAYEASYADDPQYEAADPGSTVHLCRIDDRLKVSFLESLLNEAEILFYTKEGHIQSGLLSRDMAGIFDFFVIERDLARALELVERLDAPEQLPGEDDV
jgi:hypothetical protein